MLLDNFPRKTNDRFLARLCHYFPDIPNGLTEDSGQGPSQNFLVQYVAPTREIIYVLGSRVIRSCPESIPAPEGGRMSWSKGMM